ncbi:hypothetical protein VTI74DRAFT_4576 [Chaetomium olivicolor]
MCLSLVCHAHKKRGLLMPSASNHNRLVTDERQRVRNEANLPPSLQCQCCKERHHIPTASMLAVGQRRLFFTLCSPSRHPPATPLTLCALPSNILLFPS